MICVMLNRYRTVNFNEEVVVMKWRSISVLSMVVCGIVGILIDGVSWEPFVAGVWIITAMGD